MSLSFCRTDSRQEIFDGEQLICWYDEQLSDQTVVFRLGGKLRGDTASAFQDEIRALLSVGMSIAIDLGEVTYLAPSYMQAMLNGQRMAADNPNTKIYVQNLSENARKAMTEIGALKMLAVREAGNK